MFDELEHWTRLCSLAVKKKHGCIASDCHNACEALAEVLNEKGYSATSIKTVVMFEKSVVKDHSVVLATNHILDPTFGQFQEVPDCPDYFVCAEQSMLTINREFAAGDRDSYGFVRVSDVEVAYFPYDCLPVLTRRLVEIAQSASVEENG